MLLTLFCWFALIFFFAASIRKAMYYANLPLHGRQDLYPVPLNDEEKNAYGGSYMEEDKWYEKPHHHNMKGMIIDMLGEMLFIKKLFINQNRFWWISYALHLGIYAALAWTALLFFAALSTEGSIFYTIWKVLLTIAGLVSGGLMTIGAAGLIGKRLFAYEFKIYTTPQEFFNLFFLLAVAVTGLLTFVLNGFSFNYGIAIASAMLGFDPLLEVCAAMGVTNTGILLVHIILLGLVMLYIPLCKMSHYVGKYFTFHNVIWDTDPNLPGSKIEQRVIDDQRIKVAPEKNWSAPHYQPAPAPAEAPAEAEEE